MYDPAHDDQVTVETPACPGPVLVQRENNTPTVLMAGPVLRIREKETPAPVKCVLVGGFCQFFSRGADA